MDDVMAILLQTADDVYAIDRNQRIIFWNAAAEHILGYQAEDVIGHACDEIFAGKPRPGYMVCGPSCPVVSAASRQEIVPTYNLLSRTKHGETILLNVSVIVPPVGDRPFAAIHLFRDATRQLHYETYVERQLCAAARLPGPSPTPVCHNNHPMPYAPLSAREKEVLYLLVRGKASRDIADILCISYATVRNHIQTILCKLGVHSQREAVKLASEQQLV